jgi:hypothetical protein
MTTEERVIRTSLSVFDKVLLAASFLVGFTCAGFETLGLQAVFRALSDAYPNTPNAQYGEIFADFVFGVLTFLVSMSTFLRIADLVDSRIHPKPVTPEARS